MRKHPRSPWDVLHPGRLWAMDSVGDQTSDRQILALLLEHFRQNRPYQSVEAVMDKILAAFAQAAPVTTEEQAAAEDVLEEASEPPKE